MLQNKYPLLIIGDGSSHMELNWFINSLNLSNVYILKKNYNELSSYYKNALVLVHPSEWPEPFSRVWLEAIQNNLPIISSDNKSAIEIFSNKIYYYESSNYQSLKIVLTEFLQTDNSKTPNYTNIKKNFDPKVITQSIEDIYSKLI